MCLQQADGEVRHIRVATAPGRYEGVNIGQAVIINDTPLNEIR